MGNPAPAGARVVVLDEALAVAADRRGRPRAARGTGASARRRGRSATRPMSRASFTPEGVGLRPFSVVHVEQPWRKARSPGDLTIRWTRRSRALAADSWSAAEVPLAEETRGLRGRDPRRRHRPAHARAPPRPASTYTAAQQIADWGALLGPGDTLDIRIFQLSALVGRGAPEIRHPPVLKATHARRHAPISCCRTCSRPRRRSMSPTTRRCGCSTGSCSSPCSTAT